MRSKRKIVVAQMRWSLLFSFALVVFVLFANTKYTAEQAPLAPANNQTSNAEASSQSTKTLALTPAPKQRKQTLAASETKASKAKNENKTRATEAKVEELRLQVKKNDTISEILERVGHGEAIPEMLALGKRLRPFHKLLPNNVLRLETTSGRLTTLIYESNPTLHHVLKRDDAGFHVSEREFDLEKKIMCVSGKIGANDSFYLAAAKTGLSDKVIMSIVNILDWNIDFTNDIREGDAFSALYEKKYYKNREELGDGDVLAIRFHNRDRIHEFARYQPTNSKTGYYSSDGRDARKSFLRNPLEISATISSRFSRSRLHPIFNVRRPHRGVDYAASAGSRVRATGDGRIIKRTRDRGYGNHVIIEHGGGYRTLYAHLQKFKRGQRVGSRVKQKEVIGYVGSSGYATGPHLHYEFRVNGVHKDPISVRLPLAKKLPKKELKVFNKKTEHLFAQVRNTKLATR